MRPKSLPALAAEDVVRFLGKVRRAGESECWDWGGQVHPSGYGHIRIGSRVVRAHRVAWAIARGPIPDGICVLHACDNRRCCNPGHLFLGTNMDNYNDMVAKGRCARPSGDNHYTRLHPERVLRGESHHRAKLTESQVLEIRNLYATGAYRHCDIAAMYGMSVAAICAAVNRRSWSHI